MEGSGSWIEVAGMEQSTHKDRQAVQSVRAESTGNVDKPGPRKKADGFNVWALAVMGKVPALLVPLVFPPWRRPEKRLKGG